MLKNAQQCTEVSFASFLSGEFTTMSVINPTERKLAKRSTVQWSNSCVDYKYAFRVFFLILPVFTHYP